MSIRCRKAGICAAAVLSFGAAEVFVAADGASSQEAKQSEQQFYELIRSVAGPDLFRAYCASCHGSDAKGRGPAAGALKREAPDLTALARNNKGVFPAARVRAVIMGDDVIAAHGSRDMPVWGPIFHQIEEDVDRGNVRLENLEKYLESIQATSVTPKPGKHVDKAPIANSTSPSGAILYKRHCAACHGNDLKGNGPAPPPFKEFAPDLTTLATRHGGKFPDTFFSNVLRSGVKLPAHGPAEMPIWGTTFTESEHLNESQITLRITALASYVKSLQAK